MRLTASIRRRLVAILIGLFVATWLGALAATYAASARRIGVLFDARLAQDAGALLLLAEQEPATVARDGTPRQIPIDSPRFRKVLAFVAWRDGRMLLRSENAPGVARPEEAGYSSTTIDGRAWREYRLLSPQQNLVIWAGERKEIRDQLVYELAFELLVPMLLALPLLGVAVWWGVGRGLLPLARVTSEVAARSPLNLEPVGAVSVPVEIRPLTGKLDDLLSRLRVAFDLERRFTSDAAHEIRTPLATIKTHAQVALRTAQADQRHQSLEQVIEGVDRVTRLVEQLLTLARLDREALEGQFVPVGVAAVAAEVLEALRTEAEAKRIVLRSRTAPELEVRGNPIALAIMLRNIVDNAVRYTPEGGAVEIVTRADDGEIVLAVTDNGPGVAPGERARIFDRFFRGAGASASGCGLGLSIARRVAELHRGRIELADAPAGRGLRVTVHLPRRQS